MTAPAPIDILLIPRVMAKLPAIISVHVQFPKNVILNTELDLDQSNWEWNKSLAFPVSKLKNLRLSLKPYKWIRYATGIVMGARGELCTERELPNPVPIDYDSGLCRIRRPILPYPRARA